MTERVDYFKSKGHEEACIRYIKIERERIHALIESEGPLAAVSLCVAMLSAYPSFMKTLGLKKVAVNLLKDALAEARKGAGNVAS